MKKSNRKLEAIVDKYWAEVKKKLICVQEFEESVADSAIECYRKGLARANYEYFVYSRDPYDTAKDVHTRYLHKAK